MTGFKGMMVGLGLALLGGCAGLPPRETPTTHLLTLSSEVLEAATVEDRRRVKESEQSRFEADPTYHNMLRMAVVRALTAVLPPELEETRNDLQALVNDHVELTDGERRVALLVLIMVDERLRLGAQISALQRQIDGLTEIEATLNHSNGQTTGGATAP